MINLKEWKNKALSVLDLPKNIIINKRGRSLVKKIRNDKDDL